MRHYFEDFKYCPRCGQEYTSDDFDSEGTFFTCKVCGFKFFQNSKPVVALIIPKMKDKSQILLTQRAVDPHKGLLDTPGGFLNYAEDSLDGAIREISEELQIDITIEKILFTINESYAYQGLLNDVLVVFFLAEPIDSVPKNIDNKENSDCRFYKISEIISSPEKMAFKSDYKALKKYAENLK